MIRLLPISIGCLAALSFSAASAQAARTSSNEPTLRTMVAKVEDAAAAALAEANKRPYLGGYWVLEKPVDRETLFMDPDEAAEKLGDKPAEKAEKSEKKAKKAKKDD